MKKKWQAHLFSLGLGMAFLILWEFMAKQLSPLVLPTPVVVFKKLIQGFRLGYFYPHILTTLLEVVLGLGLGGFLGLFVGIMIWESEFLKRVFSSYIIISQAIPKIAIAPLFMLWFGYGILAKVVITALICFFPLMEATATAIQQVSKDQLSLFKVIKATRLQTLWHLKLPSGLPTIMQGVRVAVINSLVGAIVGEFIGAHRGLGALIIASEGKMDTALMFAVLVILVVIGLAMYGLINAIENKLWYRRSQKHENKK